MRTNLWAMAFLAAAGSGGGGGAKRPEAGAAAPDFQAAASDGKTHSLAEYKGKHNVILAFFPKVFTPG